MEEPSRGICWNLQIRCKEEDLFPWPSRSSRMKQSKGSAPHVPVQLPDFGDIVIRDDPESRERFDALSDRCVVNGLISVEVEFPSSTVVRRIEVDEAPR